MKNILHKVRHRKEGEAPLSKRITNETVAAHRERILAGGRKFKYPVQYARHKLVFNAVIITTISVLILAGVGWWLLYPMQNSSQFMYRVTQIVPLPVASVDGEAALYRDYLSYYRPSEFYLDKYGEVKLDTKDGGKQLNYMKRQALDQAEMVAYARSFAGKYDIKVTGGDIDKFIQRERSLVQGGVSQETYDTSIKMIYGESIGDYRIRVANGILKNQVAFAVDTNATNQVDKVQELLKRSGADLQQISSQLASSPGGRVTFGQLDFSDSVTSKLGIQLSDIADLKTGEVSDVIKSTSNYGYYFVKVVSRNGGDVKVEYLNVPLTKFTKDFNDLKKDHKINEYITINDIS